MENVAVRVSERQGGQVLAQYLIRAQEEERARIARRLHDELTQQLILLRWDVESLAKGSLDPVGLREWASNTIKWIDAFSEDVQQFLAELRPPFLGKLGLLEALCLYVQNWQNKFNIPCSLETVGTEAKIPEVRAIAALRIAQEALTNVVRHAHASQVTIKAETRSLYFRLVVADDGIGIPGERLRSLRECLGVLGMIERARAIGGEIKVENEPGRGTRIILTLPLDQEGAG